MDNLHRNSTTSQMFCLLYVSDLLPKNMPDSFIGQYFEYANFASFNQYFLHTKFGGTYVVDNIDLAFADKCNKNRNFTYLFLYV